MSLVTTAVAIALNCRITHLEENMAMSKKSKLYNIVIDS
jgi:hypothetical protein